MGGVRRRLRVMTADDEERGRTMEDDVGGSGVECPRSFGAGMGRAPRPYLLPLLPLLIRWGGGLGGKVGKKRGLDDAAGSVA